jgi:hypothetical protein
LAKNNGTMRLYSKAIIYIEAPRNRTIYIEAPRNRTINLDYIKILLTSSILYIQNTELYWLNNWKLDKLNPSSLPEELSSEK